MKPEIKIVNGMRVTQRKSVRASERDLVIKYAKRCLRVLAKKEYELPFTYQSAVDSLRIIVNCAGKASYGGARYISIDVGCYRGGQRYFSEYLRIIDDPTIGRATFKTPEGALAALVAHEVAHHVQFKYGHQTRWLKGKWREPHGQGWRSIYRILRREVVNDMRETC